MQCYVFKDALIYESDLELIEDTSGWLNDNCINFASWLILHGGIENKYVKILDPSVVSFLKLQCTDDDEFEELAIGLNITSEQVIFIPINNCNSLSNNATGTHWSLLVLLITQMIGIHLDSCSNSTTKSNTKRNNYSAQLSAAIDTSDAFSKVLR